MDDRPGRTPAIRTPRDILDILIAMAGVILAIVSPVADSVWPLTIGLLLGVAGSLDWASRRPR